jgi:hypothetical protein
MGKIRPDKELAWTPEKFFDALAVHPTSKVRSFLKTSLRERILENAYHANGNRRIDKASVAVKLKSLFNGLEMLANQGRLKYLFEVPAFTAETLLDSNAPLLYVNCTRLATIFRQLANELKVNGLQPSKICANDDPTKRFVTKTMGVAHPNILGKFSCIDPQCACNVRYAGNFNRFAFVNHDIVGAAGVGAYPFYDPTLCAVYAVGNDDPVDFWLTRVNDNLFELDIAKGDHGRGPNCTVGLRHNPPQAGDVRLVRIGGGEPRYDLEIA